MYRAALILLLFTSHVLGDTLQVEFSGDRTVTGNLVVVLSPEKFRAPYPGLMNVYSGQVLVKSGLRMEPGTSATFELPVGVDINRWYAGAYLDENRNFMWRGLPDGGEFFSAELVQLTSKPKRLVLNQQYAERLRKPPPWIHEQSFVSSVMLEEGFSREHSTLRFLVGLPPGYWQSDETYPVVYVSHGFNGDRWTYIKRYKMWRNQMESEPMILISLDSHGLFGHHLFLNSEANGSRMDVFTKELVPYIDKRFRTNGKRIVYGQSSGGWTAVSLLRRAPDLVSAAVATGPDPLQLDNWWMDESKNLYTNADGTTRNLIPSVGLSMKDFVDMEIQTQSFGQFAGFLAAFSPYRPEKEGLPFESPFDLETGELREHIWQQWKENDMGAWSRSHPTLAKEAFADRLVLIVGDEDEFGLYQTTLDFSATLDSLKIPHRLKVVEGAGHSNYLEEPEFAAECWSLFYKLAGPTGHR